MRFAVIDIPAFGPFTDFRYEFPANNEADFHIFLGNNESGKSSLLRAISDLLYGIPRQTSENFRHDYKKLVLQAELYNSQDQHLHICRRKANTEKQLTTKNGSPLPQEVLNAFMGNLSRENFHSLFGLGADELQQGNEMLLSTQGALADTIAAASSGSVHLSRAVQSLLEQSEAIYKKGTSHSRMRRVKKEINDLKGELRGAMTRPQVWNDLLEKQRMADTRQLQIKQELALIEQNISHAERMKQGLESVGRLASREAELSELGLPSAFATGNAESLGGLLTTWQAANDANTQARQRVDKFNAELQALTCRMEFVESEAEIDQLNANLNVYKDRSEKAIELKAALSGKKLELDAAIRNFSKKAGLEAIEDIRITSEQQLNCSEKYDLYTELSIEQESLDKQIADTSKQLQELLNQPLVEQAAKNPVTESSPADATGLNELTLAIESGLQQKSISEGLQAQELQQKRAATELELLVTRLNLDKRPEDVRALKVPQRNTIVEFRDRLADLSQHKDSMDTELVQLLNESSKLEAEINSLLGERDLPSKASLQTAREHRDQMWNAIRHAGSTVAEADKPDLVSMESEFHKATLTADTIADALISNAELVAEADQKNGSLHQLHIKKTQIEKQRKENTGQLQALQTDWKKIWLGIRHQPESPASMLDWHDDWVKACDSTREHDASQEKFQQQKNSVSESLSRLTAIPGLHGSSGLQVSEKACRPEHLGALVNAANERKRQIDEAQGASRRTQEIQHKSEAKLAELEREKKNLATKMSAAGSHLVSAFAAIGINVKVDTGEGLLQEPDGAAMLSPSSAQQLLQQRLSLVTDYDDYKVRSKEMAQLDDMVKGYQRDVTIVAKKLKVLQDSDNTEALCNRLVQMLREQRNIYEKRLNLELTIKGEVDSLQDSDTALQSSLALLASSLKIFNVASPAELVTMQSKFTQSDKLVSEIRLIKDNLAAISTGMDLHEFIEEVTSHDLDKLAANGAELKTRKRELEAENEELVSDKTLLQQRRQAVDDVHGDAADIKQRLELALAQQREAVLDFIRIRLSADMLKRTLEEFRDKNEGPLINDASSIFKRLTCGHYERIALAYTADEKPYIQGERANGEKLQVDAMSDGTRDQLYLSMRLAALKMRLGTHEPMPLVVDDLLITFDDQRTEATLNVLADISKLTQVILFTHHARVTEAGKRLLSEHQVAITDLQAVSA